MQLGGRTAIISGGSRGIGLGIARLFAMRGANTVLLGRSQATLDAATASLAISTPQQTHRAHELNVAKSDQWDALMGGLSRHDILVNAAGITHYSLLPRTPISVVDDVVATNLLGAIYGCRAFSKAALRNSKSGDGRCIINISSALAHRGASGSSVYAASKAGLIGFTKAFAEEFGSRGIRTCAIAPGYIDTDMVSGMSEEMNKRTIMKTSVGRIGTVEEVAQAALFLVENDFMNGTTVTVDGGLTYE